MGRQPAQSSVEHAGAPARPWLGHGCLGPLYSGGTTRPARSSATAARLPSCETGSMPSTAPPANFASWRPSRAVTSCGTTWRDRTCRTSTSTPVRRSSHGQVPRAASVEDAEQVHSLAPRKAGPARVRLGTGVDRAGRRSPVGLDRGAGRNPAVIVSQPYHLDDEDLAALANDPDLVVEVDDDGGWYGARTIWVAIWRADQRPTAS